MAAPLNIGREIRSVFGGGRRAAGGGYGTALKRRRRNERMKRVMQYGYEAIVKSSKAELRKRARLQ